MTATRPPAERGRFGWRIVTPLAMGSALNPINSSVIATALVPIAAALHISVGRTSILVSSLYLACAIAQPTAGKLSEELGPRAVFLAGIALVLVGGVVGGLGRDLTLLVLARVLIGIGTSCGYPSAMLLIRRRAQRAGLDAPPGDVLGTLVIASQASVAIGPPIGGLLEGWLSWEAAFWINLPLALITLAMTLRWIPTETRSDARRSTRELAGRVDAIGILLFAVTLAALLVFVMSLPHPRWIWLAVTGVACAVFVAREQRAATPFIDLRLLVRAPALTRTYLRAGLTLFVIYVVLYGVTQWLEAARGLSVEQAGLVLLPMGAASALVSRPISRRNLIRGPLLVSGVLMVLASGAMLVLTHRSPVLALIGVMVLFGIALGTSLVGNQTALYLQAPAEGVGTASGLLRTFGYVGSIASATVTGIAFRTRVSDGGLHDMAAVLGAAAVVVLVMTAFDRRLSPADR